MEYALCPAPGSLVVGVDGSASARTAVPWTAAEADTCGRRLHIVHASHTEHRTHCLSPADVARVHRAGHELFEAAAEAVSARHPGLPVGNELSRTHLLPASPVRTRGATRPWSDTPGTGQSGEG